MIIQTRRFGDLQISEKDIIEITGGLLGFEGINRYVLLDHDAETPFKWLQAVGNPEPAFVVMEPFAFYPGYQVDLSDDEARDLELAGPEEAAVLTILTVPEDPKKMTANIKAPLVVNWRTRKGRQVMLTNESYPVKYCLFQEEKKSQGGR